MYQRWIRARREPRVNCSLVWGCSLGLAAHCRSTSSAGLSFPHSTHMGESWWSILPHRTWTELVSTVRKKILSVLLFAERRRKANYILRDCHQYLFSQLNLFILCIRANYTVKIKPLKVFPLNFNFIYYLLMLILWGIFENWGKKWHNFKLFLFIQSYLSHLHSNL